MVCRLLVLVALNYGIYMILCYFIPFGLNSLIQHVLHSLYLLGHSDIRAVSYGSFCATRKKRQTLLQNMLDSKFLRGTIKINLKPFLKPSKRRLNGKIKHYFSSAHHSGYVINISLSTVLVIHHFSGFGFGMGIAFLQVRD